MTTSVLYWTVGVYLAALLVVAFFTRATVRRVAGSLAGGVATGAVTVAVDALGEELGWWHFAFTWEPYFLALVALGWGVSVSPVFLVTWRLVRRFGWRGPAVLGLLATVIGPPRDYAFMARNPEWGYYGPGWAPVAGVAAIYAVLIPLGHCVMWLVAGPSRGSPLARRPWEAAVGQKGRESNGGQTAPDTRSSLGVADVALEKSRCKRPAAEEIERP